MHDNMRRGGYLLKNSGIADAGSVRHVAHHLKVSATHRHKFRFV